MQKITKQNLHTALPQDLVVIDFYGESCHPCKIYGPRFEAVSLRFPDVIMGKVDCSQESELTAQFGIRSIPATVFIKGGVVLDKRIGALSEDGLADLINKYKV